MSIIPALKPRRPGNVYYGWVVLGIALCIGFFTAGISQAFGIFMTPMTEEFGWSRGNLSLAISIFAVVSAIVPPAAGWISDRFGPRMVLTIGVTLNTIGMVLMSRVDSLLEVYLVYGLIIGTGFGFSGFAAITALLSRWFVRRRGMALSVASMGLGIGQLTLAPFMTFLIVSFSWQTAFVITGVLSAVIIPICFLFLNRQEPANADDLTSSDDPQPSDPPTCITNEMIKEDLNIAWTTRSFWMVASGFMSCGFTIYFLTAHMVPLAIDRGISATEAGTALGIVGGTGVLSNFIIAMLSDRYPRRYVLAGLYSLRGVAIATLFLTSGVTMLYVFAILFGLSRANGAVVSATIIDVYGRRAVGTLVGYLTMFHQLFAAAGAYFGGLNYDLAGNYHIMLIIAFAAMVNATIASLFIREGAARPTAEQASTPALQPAVATIEPSD